MHTPDPVPGGGGGSCNDPTTASATRLPTTRTRSGGAPVGAQFLRVALVEREEALEQSGIRALGELVGHRAQAQSPRDRGRVEEIAAEILQDAAAALEPGNVTPHQKAAVRLRVDDARRREHRREQLRLATGGIRAGQYDDGDAGLRLELVDLTQKWPRPAHDFARTVGGDEQHGRAHRDPPGQALHQRGRRSTFDVRREDDDAAHFPHCPGLGQLDVLVRALDVDVRRMMRIDSLGRSSA